MAERRWQSRLPMAVGFEGGTHTVSSPPHGDRFGRGGTSRMTIQLTQRWDCGSRDPFRSSGTWTPQAERMTWGGGDGAGEGEGKREGGGPVRCPAPGHRLASLPHELLEKTSSQNALPEPCRVALCSGDAFAQDKKEDEGAASPALPGSQAKGSGHSACACGDPPEFVCRSDLGTWAEGLAPLWTEHGAKWLWERLGADAAQLPGPISIHRLTSASQCLGMEPLLYATSKSPQASLCFVGICGLLASVASRGSPVMDERPWRCWLSLTPRTVIPLREPGEEEEKASFEHSEPLTTWSRDALLKKIDFVRERPSPSSECFVVRFREKTCVYQNGYRPGPPNVPASSGCAAGRGPPRREWGGARALPARLHEWMCQWTERWVHAPCAPPHLPCAPPHLPAPRPSLARAPPLTCPRAPHLHLHAHRASPAACALGPHLRIGVPPPVSALREGTAGRELGKDGAGSSSGPGRQGARCPRGVVDPSRGACSEGGGCEATADIIQLREAPVRREALEGISGQGRESSPRKSGPGKALGVAPRTGELQEQGSGVSECGAVATCQMAPEAADLLCAKQTKSWASVDSAFCGKRPLSHAGDDGLDLAERTDLESVHWGGDDPERNRTRGALEPPPGSQRVEGGGWLV
ncbi:unnamed protein product [Rangifer tarandus platyrhynchus]|uniref:Uncharacterized protein n=1 Tax=Rangifer tarandus platyrhynchus TaxID=3082113 RepID=A0ABN8Y5T8_RANTA|nr:unnamed protein product [Rangifer tarandus platyrhynchus]